MLANTPAAVLWLNTLMKLSLTNSSTFFTLFNHGPGMFLLPAGLLPVAPIAIHQDAAEPVSSIREGPDLPVLPTPTQSLPPPFLGNARCIFLKPFMVPSVTGLE